LTYSGGRLEDESVQVQVVEDMATGERLALIIGRQRIIFHGGSWLELRVVVDRSLEQAEYNYPLQLGGGRPHLENGQAPWARGAVAHHRPGDRPDPYPEVEITDVLSAIVKQLEWAGAVNRAAALGPEPPRASRGNALATIPVAVLGGRGRPGS
jgi:hypothetical protein